MICELKQKVRAKENINQIYDKGNRTQCGVLKKNMLEANVLKDQTCI
jgi:hypothetical protein